MFALPLPVWLREKPPMPFGLQKGYPVEQADAEAAYTQTEIDGDPDMGELVE